MTEPGQLTSATGNTTPSGATTMPEPIETFSVGAYRQCLTCQAPIVSPLPTAWTLDLIKEGPRTGPVNAVCTPHVPDCATPLPDPQPGIAVRISGRYAVRISGTYVVDVGLGEPE